VQARVIFNATGPWTDEIARLEDPRAGPAVRGTKGVHVAVPASRVGNRSAVTMLSPDDGRVMFTLPSGAQTIIGTTDTASDEHPHEVRASRADVRYLLSAANRFFPAAKLTEDDVIATWAGIRPLVARTNKGDPASASREHAITRSRRGVLVVTGGKLTTYRAMAQQCVDTVLRTLGKRCRPCDTMRAPLDAPRPAASPDDVPLARDLMWRESDVLHAANAELAETVGDVLIRRTTLAFETRDHGRSVAARVAALMADRLHWTDAGARNAVEEYDREATRVFSVNEAR
jgi:glycerol-3-phosphate dehydrogenase